MFALGSARLLPLLSPLFWLYVFQLEHKLKNSLCFAFPPFVEGHATPIVQQIAIPILTSADAPIARFDRPYFAFRVIVGSGKLRTIVALDEIGTHIREHLQKVLEAFLFHLWQRCLTTAFCQAVSPSIKSMSYLLVGDRVGHRGPAPIQNVFGLQHPSVSPEQSARPTAWEPPQAVSTALTSAGKFDSIAPLFLHLF
ncbi:MAG: hypothetical protein H0U76_29845 [Ktedonobacteraceae bacterium]|nr:hypothetical protein [Ktedonobacteraceae bacterium]